MLTSLPLSLPPSSDHRPSVCPNIHILGLFPGSSIHKPFKQAASACQTAQRSPLQRPVPISVSSPPKPLSTAHIMRDLDLSLPGTALCSHLSIGDYQPGRSLLKMWRLQASPKSYDIRIQESGTRFFQSTEAPSPTRTQRGLQQSFQTLVHTLLLRVLLKCRL